MIPRATRVFIIGMATVLAFAASGCVELIGQRISIYHDAAANRLDLLIYYDGIHDNVGDHDDGPEQLRDAIANGDVMFLDWPWHFQRAELREFVNNPDEPQAQRDLARSILDRVQATPVGHYRDHLDQIGALQRVRIEQADAFMQSLNDAWNLWLRERDRADDDPELARTTARWDEAVVNDHTWIRLRGHALEFNIPVHPVDMPRLKAAGLRSIIGAEMEASDVNHVIRALSAAPLSLIDHGDHLVIRIGEPDTPSTLRFTIREPDVYEPNLEQELIRAIPTDLHASIRARMETGPVDDAIQAAITYGPPEHVVEAWLDAADDATFMHEQVDALNAIHEFAADHHERMLEPPDRDRLRDPDTALRLWRQWCNRMWAFPLEP